VAATEVLDPYEIAKGLVKDAVENLGLDDSVYELLKNPQKFVEVSIPVEMDDGSVQSFIGYRSFHNNALGPTKGGIRFHPDVTPEEVKALSVWMTIKSSLLGLPYGGGKGGVLCNPADLSPRELEALSRGYIRAMAPHMGPYKDVPAPDVNTNPQVMAWMFDEYSSIVGENTFGLLTGKPLILGGSKGRVEATGRGTVVTIKQAANHLDMNLAETTTVVQGFGNVGSVAARLMHDAGSKVIAVMEVDGGVYNPEGLDIPKMLEYKVEHGSVAGYPDGEPISNDELLTLECDILIPAALENQITSRNAHDIKAKIVAEAANGPTTPEADRIMTERGILVIPDILANAGGVTVSYFEWVQNLYGYYWTEEEVNSKLEQMMRQAFDWVYNMHTERGMKMRDVAYMVAISRLAEAMKVRGWLPAQRSTYRRS